MQHQDAQTAALAASARSCRAMGIQLAAQRRWRPAAATTLDEVTGSPCSGHPYVRRHDHDRTGGETVSNPSTAGPRVESASPPTPETPMTLVIPIVTWQDGREEWVVDIYSRLFREGIIFVGTPIDEQIANLVVAELMHLSRSSRTEISRSTSTRRAAPSTRASRSTTRCSSSGPTCRRCASAPRWGWGR